MPISVPLDRSLISDPSLSPVADKVERGERLSDADGVALFESNDLLAIGHMADRVNLAKNGTTVTDTLVAGRGKLVSMNFLEIYIT